MPEFERARREEAEFLRNFVQNAFGNDITQYDDNAPVRGTVSDFEADAASGRIWKLTDDEKLIGLISIRIDNAHTGHIEYICVDNARRKQGIGTKAITWAEENYRILSWKTEIPRSLPHADEFLKKNGFRTDASDHAAAIYTKSMLEHADIDNGGNLFDDSDIHGRNEEYFETLKQIPGLIVERIISRGQTSPDTGFYDQDWTEIVFIVQGSARLEIEGVIHSLHTGDWRCLLPHVRHRVIYTSKDPACIWLAVHQK